MDYSEFIKKIDICDEKTSVAILSNEPYLLDDIIARLKKKYISDDNMDFLEVDAADVNEMEVVNFCNSFSMFSDRKLLVLNSANNLSLSANALDSIMDSDAIKLFIFDNKKGYYKKISSRSVLVQLDKLKEVILIKWIIKKFADLNKEISVATAKYLVKLSTYLEYNSKHSLYDISASISKIASVNEEEIKKSTIDKMLSIPSEDDVFKLKDSVAKRDVEHSLETYYELHKSGVDVYIIVPTLSRLFYQLNIVKHLSDKGLSVSQIGEAINIRSDYIVRKIISQTKYFNTEALLRNLNKCLECERKYKSEKVNIHAEVEMLILELCK